jgi:hypothetical protein
LAQTGLSPLRRHQDGGIRHGNIKIDVHLAVPMKAHFGRDPAVIPDKKGVAFYDLCLGERV